MPVTAVADVIDFEGMSAGLPPNWQVAMTGEGREPRWEIVRDRSSLGGPSVLAQTSTHRKFRRFPLAIYQPAEVADGMVSVELKAVSGGVDQSGGIVWRFVDENNYYVVRASVAQGNVVLMKCENGDRRTIGRFGQFGRDDDFSPDPGFDRDRWTKLEVSFAGPRIAVALDGRQLFEANDSTFRGPGKVGLWTQGDSVTLFDRFEFVAE